MTAEESGTVIYDLLDKRKGGGSTRSGACAELEITFAQWTRGRAWLRDDVFGGRDPVVRNWIGNEWVYLLAEYAGVEGCVQYWHRLLRTQLTRSKREYGDAHGIAQAHPGVLEFRMQEESARRRMTDLEFALERFTAEDV